MAFASTSQNKENGPFRCPDCGDSVIFKNYTDRRSHFAHRADAVCGYENGETETHRYCKESIYRSLLNHPSCSECYMEFRHYSRQPDIFACINGQWVAIEIQNSNIPLAQISAKLSYYHEHAISALYILPHSIPGDGSTMALSEWQRYLHAMYRDNLYYWFDQDRVAVVHLGQYKVNGSATRDSSFYAQMRPVSRYGRYVSITEFSPMPRRENEILNRHIGMADASLWQHRLGDWWTQ